ncbi:hypothetical protein RFI_02304, partial [Reticulomyxa filosa]
GGKKKKKKKWLVMCLTSQEKEKLCEWLTVLNHEHFPFDADLIINGLGMIPLLERMKMTTWVRENATIIPLIDALLQNGSHMRRSWCPRHFVVSMIKVTIIITPAIQCENIRIKAQVSAFTRIPTRTYPTTSELRASIQKQNRKLKNIKSKHEKQREQEKENSASANLPITTTMTAINSTQNYEGNHMNIAANNANGNNGTNRATSEDMETSKRIHANVDRKAAIESETASIAHKRGDALGRGLVAMSTADDKKNDCEYNDDLKTRESTLNASMFSPVLDPFGDEKKEESRIVVNTMVKHNDKTDGNKNNNIVVTMTNSLKRRRSEISSDSIASIAAVATIATDTHTNTNESKDEMIDTADNNSNNNDNNNNGKDENGDDNDDDDECILLENNTFPNSYMLSAPNKRRRLNDSSALIVTSDHWYSICICTHVYIYVGGNKEHAECFPTQTNKYM